ncbi:hypothetical protein H8959_012633, partial [Pygathrix nigripes]
GALVLGYEGWLASYQMNFENAKSRVTQRNSAVGYKTDEFRLHTTVNDRTEFGSSIYQKVNNKLETTINLAWTAGNSNTSFGIAAKYQIDPDACFSAKVNNSSLRGLRYTQTLKPGLAILGSSSKLQLQASHTIVKRPPRRDDGREWRYAGGTEWRYAGGRMLSGYPRQSPLNGPRSTGDAPAE